MLSVRSTPVVRSEQLGRVTSHLHRKGPDAAGVKQHLSHLAAKGLKANNKVKHQSVR